MTYEYLTKFAHLFAGNTTAHGTEQGGCQRTAVDENSYSDHLLGVTPIGIYPMVWDGIDWFVRWGCVDLDVQAPHKRRWDYDTTDDAWTAARNLHDVLAALNITSWIEATKSGGFHVWVFPEDWVTATRMRHCLLAACSVADVPPTEVNPKNERFDSPDTLGNYVRLPYPAAFADELNRPILDPNDGIPYGVHEFIDEAWNQRTCPTTITEIAALWRPPVLPVAQPTVSPTRYHEAVGTMSRRLRAVVDNGPLRQEDRSGWLYYVARLCADDGLAMQEACDIVALCDEMHTHKFTGRNDGATRIAQTVQKAYA